MKCVDLYPDTLRITGAHFSYSKNQNKMRKISWR